MTGGVAGVAVPLQHRSISLLFSHFRALACSHLGGVENNRPFFPEEKITTQPGMPFCAHFRVLNSPRSTRLRLTFCLGSIHVCILSQSLPLPLSFDDLDDHEVSSIAYTTS